MARPTVSVVVPYRGDLEGAERLVRSLTALDLDDGDEVIVADNSDEPVFEDLDVPVVRASGEHSSYHARNVGAAAVSGEWILFTDSDCVPEPGLLGRYMDGPPPAEAGALAGSVRGGPDQSHFLARYATDRGLLDQEAGLHTANGAAATANLMVRRTAFDEVGGFTEGIKSGGDVDFCRRLVAAGWNIERRPEATVVHLHRESLPDLMRMFSRYASGARWLNERYPGSAPQWPLAMSLKICAKDIARDVAGRRFERAAFRGVDALGMFAHAYGYRRSNAP